MDKEYDAIVIGAGIGGLATAAVLAKDGMKVAVLEREDRVGGRALSLEGSEISEKGADWYRAVLGRHYCYLAEASPSIEEIVAERMLDGYVIDLGYHGVPCAGQGYLGRLVDYLGVDVKVNPCDTGLYYKGEFYVEPAPGSARLDDKLYKICKEKGINYWSFNTEALGLTAEQLDELEKVSLWDYCERLGLTADDVVWEAYHCLGTLFTTINNPHDISAGEIIRYTNDIMMPVITSGRELHVGGFAEGGILNWSKAVAGVIEGLGGTIVLGADVEHVRVEGGKVKGRRRGPARRRACPPGSGQSGQHRSDPGDLRPGGRNGIPRRFRVASTLALRLRQPRALFRAVGASNPSGAGGAACQDADGSACRRRLRLRHIHVLERAVGHRPDLRS